MSDRKKEIIGILIRIAVAAVLFTAAVVNYDKLSNLDVEKLLSGFDNTALIIAVVLALYAVKGLIFVLPASVIYVAVGVILDTWLAIAVNLAGIFIEITVTYVLGRFLRGNYVKNLLSKKKAGQKLLEMNIQDKKSVIFTIRLLPVFPIDFASLFFGASESSAPLYMLLSVLGLAPRVILFTVIGDNLFKWIPMDKLIFIIICCIPIGIIVYLLKKLFKKRNKQ